MDIGFNMRQVQVIFLAIFAIVFITFLATVSMPAVKMAGSLYAPTVGYFSNVKEMPKEASDSIPEQIAEEKGVPEQGYKKLDVLTETEFVTAAADVNVTQCINLTISNRVYQLNQSIGGNQSFWVEIDWQHLYPCINIKADNIVLDCGGYSITGSSSEDIGIYAQGRKNITIENCNISDYYNGIYATYTNNSNFKNNMISGVYADGIVLNISNNNYFFNNTIDVMHFGVSVYDSNNTTFRNTTINNAGRGFFVGAPEYALGDTGKLYSVDVDNKTNFVDGLPIQFFDSFYKACPNDQVLSYVYNYSLIAFYGCDNITFGQTTATDGVYFWMTPNSYIGFVDSSNSEYGLYIAYSDNVTIKDSLFWMDNYGIFSHLSNNLSIEENIINDSYFMGINLILSDSSYLFNNSLNSLDSLYGIYIQISNDVKLRNNSVIKAPGYSGIQVGGSPTIRNDVDTTNTVDGFPVKYIDGLHVACPNNTVVSYLDSYSMVGFVDCVNVTLNFTAAEDSIYFYFMKDSSVIDSEVFNSSSGVYITNANNVSISDSSFEDNGENFYIYDSVGVHIVGNNVTNGEGVFSYNLSNSVIEQNIMNCSSYYSGIYFIDSDSNNITGNQIRDGSHGIYLDESNNNKLVDNFITNSGDNDFYSNNSNNNVIINLTTTDTSSNFTYAGALELAHADDIAPPTNYGDINHFLNISGDRWISINVSYTDSDVTGVNTSTIRLWKYSSGSWSNLTGSVNGINTAGKYVYANITNFSSTFAPLGNITATCELVCDSESCVENNNTPGVKICLNASINAALTIAADNQTLDCNGYSLTGTGSDYGVNVSRKVNVTIKNCNINSFDYCINIFRTNYSYVVDNNIDNCTTVGIVVSGVDSGYNNLVRDTVNNSNVGILISGSDYDNITNNTIMNSGNHDLDLSDAVGLLAINQILNDTATSFVLDGDVTFDWEPSHGTPNGYSGVGHYLAIVKNSVNLWLYLNMSYSDSDIAGIAESSLRLWKNSSGEWSQKLNESGTLVSGVNTAANYVYANISNFSSVFAPMGATPISITVVSPLNISYNNQTLWFNITTNYNAFTCKMNLDGHGNVTMQNSSLTRWYNQTTGLSETLHNVTYWCNHTTGLTSDQKIIYFTVDVAKPYINVTAPREGETLNISSTIYVNATVNEDASACKASFDNSTNITLTNSSNKRNWTGSDNLANGNHDVVVYCSDLAGNWNVSKKVSFVVYIPQEEEGRGGGTGGASTQNATSITLVWPAIAENGSSSMNISIDSIEIRAVIISVKSALKAGGLLQILQYNNKTTATTDAPGNQYKYFYFSATNIPYSNIDKATIKFRVLKSWINTTGVDNNTIKMYRFTSTWNVIETKKTGEDSKYFYYDAFTTAFSYFAITGSAVSGGANVTEQPNLTTPTVITQPTTGSISACGNGICGVGEDSTNCPVDCGAPPIMAVEAPVMILIGVIIVAVISVVAVFLLVVKPRMEAKQFEMGGPAMAGLPQVPGIEMEQRPSFIEVEMPPAKEHQLEGYVRRNLVKGITPHQIYAVLDKVGWKTEQIKKAFDLATTPPEKEEDLIGYVVRMEAKGFTPQQIRARLIQAGWKPTEVFHVMKMAAERMRGH